MGTGGEMHGLTAITALASSGGCRRPQHGRGVLVLLVLVKEVDVPTEVVF